MQSSCYFRQVKIIDRNVAGMNAIIGFGYKDQVKTS